MEWVDRNAHIVRRATGRKVLDLGVVGLTLWDDSARIDRFPESLHWRIAQVATEAVGVDTADCLPAIRDRYPQLTVHQLPAEQADELGDDFDLVVVGDLLEHVSNQGLLLDASYKALRAAGVIIVTCPNAFGLHRLLDFMVGRFVEGADHVSSHNTQTLTQLLDRHGFTVIECLTGYEQMPSGWKRVGAVILRAFPRFGGTLIVSASKRPL